MQARLSQPTNKDPEDRLTVSPEFGYLLHCGPEVILNRSERWFEKLWFDKSSERLQLRGRSCYS